jgi:hypothetical protein
MKKFIIVFILISKTFAANCDVIFFPRQYAVFCYSAEFIYSYEKVKKVKNTTVFWGGVGCVGSFIYFDQPTYGLEIAIEKRHYFQAEKYKNFFVSAYVGTAYMTDFNYAHDIGIIPGFKINYKAQISPKTILEPYISLSIPVMYDTKNKTGFFPIPVLTVGVRFGLFKLKREIKVTT